MRSSGGRIRGDGRVGRLGVGRRVRGLADPLEDLLAVDRDLLGGLDPDPHLVALDPDHGEDDVVGDVDLLAGLPSQD
jgi:hypothetical protein